MLEYINNYLGSPMSVAIDVSLLLIASVSIVGFISLRREVDDLCIAVQLLKNKIAKG